MHVRLPLAHARIWRNLSLQQLARLTGATADELAAIERGDVTRLLPGTNVEATLRAYAIAVGLDPETVIRNYLPPLIADRRSVDGADAGDTPADVPRGQSSSNSADVLSQFHSERDLVRGMEQPSERAEPSQPHGRDVGADPRERARPQASTAADAEKEKEEWRKDRAQRFYVSAAIAAVIAVSIYLTWHTMPPRALQEDVSTRAGSGRSLSTMVTEPSGSNSGSEAPSQVREDASPSQQTSDAKAVRTPHAEDDSRGRPAARSEVASPASGPVQPNSALVGIDALNGWWDMTNQVQSSTYAAYRRLRLGYRLQLQQHGRRITGQGEKWSENGRPIPGATRTPITVDGVIQGRRVALKFLERGHRRTSGGTFELMLTSTGQLAGTFASDAAQSRGTSNASRVSPIPPTQ